jgi:glutaredoxin
MILYTCAQREKLASVGHPCGRAAKALDDAGYEYELRELPGYRFAPWTWRERRRGRAQIKDMTGQIGVPVLVLDEGKMVVGSGDIVKWANAHPKAQAEVGGG